MRTMPINDLMSKYFKTLGIILLLGSFVSPMAGAQGLVYYPQNYFYRYHGPSYWSTMTGYDKAYFGVNQFFNALNYSVRSLEQNRAYEQKLLNHANRIENAKSIRRYYQEGIPAFSPVAPNGMPRSEKITWDDVDSIRP